MGQVEKPIRAVWGGADGTLPVRAAVRRTLEAAPHTPVHLIDGVGHGIPADGPSSWVLPTAGWIQGPGAEAGSITGVEPSSAAGVPEVPVTRWFMHPLLHLATSGAGAALVWRWCRRTRPASTDVIVLTIVAIAYGGTFLLRVVGGGAPANDLQRAYFRAGHAHAGVLVMLGLVLRLLLAHPQVPAWADTLSGGVLWAAILMPAGFFLSVTGTDPQQPNRLRFLIWAGAASLTVGVIAAGVGLVIAGSRGA